MGKPITAADAHDLAMSQLHKAEKERKKYATEEAQRNACCDCENLRAELEAARDKLAEGYGYCVGIEKELEEARNEIVRQASYRKHLLKAYRDYCDDEIGLDDFRTEALRIGAILAEDI